jgi:hypothetical protein
VEEVSCGVDDMADDECEAGLDSKVRFCRKICPLIPDSFSGADVAGLFSSAKLRAVKSRISFLSRLADDIIPSAVRAMINVICNGSTSCAGNDWSLEKYSESAHGPSVYRLDVNPAGSDGRATSSGKFSFKELRDSLLRKYFGHEDEKTEESFEPLLDLEKLQFFLQRASKAAEGLLKLGGVNDELEIDSVKADTSCLRVVPISFPQKLQDERLQSCLLTYVSIVSETDAKKKKSLFGFQVSYTDSEGVSQSAIAILRCINAAKEKLPASPSHLLSIKIGVAGIMSELEMRRLKT